MLEWVYISSSSGAQIVRTQNYRMIIVHFQGKPFNITVTKVYAPTTNAKEAEFYWFYEDIQHLLEVTVENDIFFIIGDWNSKVGSQETPPPKKKKKQQQASLALEYKMKQGKG